MNTTLFKALEVLQNFIDANVKTDKDHMSDSKYESLRDAIDNKVSLIEQMFDYDVRIIINLKTLHIMAVYFDCEEL